MKTIEGLPLTEAIVRMAIQTFVERGFEKASMDDVAARASTTKRTVYAHFGSKEGLFRAALARAVELFLSELPTLGDTSNPGVELEAFASRFSELCTWRGAVRLQRVVMAESERFPDLGGMLHREIIETAERTVADYLRKLDRTGINVADDDIEGWAIGMASLFLNMTTGRQRFATLLQAREPSQEHPDAKAPPDIDRVHIRRAVQIFLEGSGLSR
jgi:AcrR family transcriptional regulator